VHSFERQRSASTVNLLTTLCDQRPRCVAAGAVAFAVSEAGPHAVPPAAPRPRRWWLRCSARAPRSRVRSRRRCRAGRRRGSASGRGIGRTADSARRRSPGSRRTAGGSARSPRARCPIASRCDEWSAREAPDRTGSGRAGSVARPSPPRPATWPSSQVEEEEALKTLLAERQRRVLPEVGLVIGGVFAQAFPAARTDLRRLTLQMGAPRGGEEVELLLAQWTGDAMARSRHRHTGSLRNEFSGGL
jgi:hypothetical protein